MFTKIGDLCEVLNVHERHSKNQEVFLDSSMVERTAVNRDVVGSSPTRGVFLNIRLRGQAVKTSPFHGGNTGSIPVGVIKNINKVLTDLYSWYIVRQ